jgi:hypothetical protein
MHSDTHESSAAEHQWQHSLHQLLSAMPNDPFEAASGVSRLHRVFLGEVAEAMEPRVNGFLARAPQASFEDKREISISLGAVFRNLGIGPRCPDTGRPARLIADKRYDQARDASRFRLEVIGPDGTRTRPHTFASIVKLDLGVTPARHEPLASPRGRG